MEFRIGCSGWSYESWLGHFYPSKVESRNWLHYYSKVFDYVEIDSTFYRIPTTMMTSKWNRNTPDNFKFTAKIPESVSHEKRLGFGSDADMEYFYQAFEPLRSKMLAFLIQLPPSMTMKEGLKKLEQFPFEKGYRYAVEVRDKTWFVPEVYNAFRKKGLCLVWNQLDIIKAPAVLTTDFAYIRFIGDRSIEEKDFGTIQKDRQKEMAAWAKEVKKAKKEISLAIVAANNHYAGFGPSTANAFKRLIGEPEVVWEEMKQQRLDL